MLANWVKTCTKCGDVKDASLFNVNSQQKSGLNPSCKSCANEYAKQYHKENAEKRSISAAKRYAEKKDEILAKNKTWRENNKEWYREWGSNRITDKGRVKKWYADNAELIKENQRNYYQRNKDKAFAKSARRRAVKLQAIPLWANNRYINLWYKLAKIESDRTGQKVEVDHIIPLQGDNVCGLHCEDNMQLLFMNDNRSKGNKFPMEA